jgi:hypothetical protein
MEPRRQKPEYSIRQLHSPQGASPTEWVEHLLREDLTHQWLGVSRRSKAGGATQAAPLAIVARKSEIKTKDVRNTPKFD